MPEIKKTKQERETEEKLKQKERDLAQRKEIKKNRRNLIIISCVAFLLIAATVCGGIAYNIYISDPQNMVMLKTKNYKFTYPMFRFLLSYEISLYVQEQQESIAAGEKLPVGRDPYNENVPITRQKYNYQKSVYEYFSESILSKYRTIMLYLEAAHENGVTELTTGYHNMVVEELAILSLQSTLKYPGDENSFDKYIKSEYGGIVNRKDIETAFEMEYLAYQWFDQVLLDRPNYDPNYLIEQEKNGAATFSVYFQVFEISGVEESVAQAHADELLQSKSLSEFETWIEDYYKDIWFSADPDIAVAESKRFVQTPATRYDSRLQTQEIIDWIFNPDRKEGDIKFFKNPLTPQEYDNGYYSIIYIVHPPYDNTPSANILGIFYDETDEISGYEQAKSEYDTLLQNAGNTAITEEQFHSLWKTKKFENQVEARNAGRDDFVFENEIFSELVYKWMLNSERKAGDIFISEESDTYGNYMFYYKGPGIPMWQYTLTHSLDSQYMADYEDNTLHKKYKIKKDNSEKYLTKLSKELE